MDRIDFYELSNFEIAEELRNTYFDCKDVCELLGKQLSQNRRSVSLRKSLNEAQRVFIEIANLCERLGLNFEEE